MQLTLSSSRNHCLQAYKFTEGMLMKAVLSPFTGYLPFLKLDHLAQRDLYQRLAFTVQQAVIWARGWPGGRPEEGM